MIMMAELSAPSMGAALRRHGRAVAILLIVLGIYGCSSTPPRGGVATSTASTVPSRDGAPINPPDVMNVPDAVPRVEPRSRYGNPSSYVVMGKTYRVLAHGLDYDERGGASWYGTKFHGQRTSSGEPYDMYAMTAAHRTLPIPSYARVTNLNNGKSVVVRINDRGPYAGGRIIDLSEEAARRAAVREQPAAQRGVPLARSFRRTELGRAPRAAQWTPTTPTATGRPARPGSRARGGA